ncbi:hypothetical protein [Mycoplasmopsis edwardii]|uniref:Uncharacterized protein n=1 Tax=Mycoplasmopsis edwardii TaxID=53558 RepID=A0ACD4PHJ2_9BACT|nr:hypothetical protein [Mycoplasmopsis edwardii]WBP84105.1 hypothetical protein Me_995_000054 [Mycoplasmopsis edwardii]
MKKILFTLGSLSILSLPVVAISHATENHSQEHKIPFIPLDGILEFKKASEFENLQEFYDYMDSLATKIGSSMQDDYSSIKQMLNTSEDVVKLPLTELASQIEKLSDMTNPNFADISLIWDSVFNIMKEQNFNYTNILKHEVREKIKTFEDLSDANKFERLRSVFLEKQNSEQLLIKFAAIEIEILSYLKLYEQSENADLLREAKAVLTSDTGINTSNVKMSDAILVNQERIKYIRNNVKKTYDHKPSNETKEEDKNISSDDSTIVDPKQSQDSNISTKTAWAISTSIIVSLLAFVALLAVAIKKLKIFSKK